VFCSRCGKPLPDGATSCPSCGATVQATGAAPAGVPAGGEVPASGTPATDAPARYAGFWRRFWAFIVDGFILGVVMMPFGIGLWGTIAAIGQAGGDEMETIAQIIAASMMAWMLRMLASLLYGALFESSAWQATPGKKLLGLRVTDLEGRRISFLRASGRAFGKWLSGLVLCIGYIMVAFTEKKQGLHDMLAGTVVRR